MNAIVMRCFLEHSGFDKLKYNLEYYRQHMDEKRAYNRKYYQENKEKWGIQGGNQSTSQHDMVRKEAEKKADQYNLSGSARDQFISAYIKKNKSYIRYDSPIGPSPRKKPSIEKVADKVFSHIPGYSQLYGGSVYNFINSSKMFFKNVKSLGTRQGKVANFVNNFSDEDLNNIKKKLNDMQKKLNDTNQMINKVKTKVYDTVSKLL